MIERCDFWGLDLIANPGRGAEDLLMDTDRQQRIQELRTLIDRGDYVVDPHRIADSVVRCVSALAYGHEDSEPQPATRHRARRVRGGIRGGASRCRTPKAAVVAAAG